MYDVYAKYDEEGLLLRIENEAPEGEEGWELIDQGEGGPKYEHAQNNYMDGPLVALGAGYRYRRGEGGMPVLREGETPQA